MTETKYSEAAVEVLDILNYTNKEDVKRIPQSFINFLNNISNKDYKPRFNHEQPINGFNLREQTKELLGFIYITWWCNEEERERYKKVINLETVRYDINEIFRNRQAKEQTIIQNENTSMIEYKEDTLLKKFLRKILTFFRGK